jgi:hypothetical protein
MKRRDLVRALALAVAVALCATSAASRAAELGVGDGVGDVALDVHGFVSQGAILSTGNNYLAKSKRGSLEFTEVGVNFTSQLTDRLRLGLQLFAHQLGPVGTYQAHADWFYLDYRWRDWFGIRAGRVKLPFGLYNETSDIDAARVAILLPQSVYPVSNRDFLLAQTGVEIYGYVDLRGAGALEYRLYGGTIYIDVSANPAIRAVDVPYVAGGRAMWETPVPGLRLGGSVQALRLTFQFQSDPAMPAMPPVSAGLSAILGIGSAEFVRNNLTLAAEFAQWRVAVDTADLAHFPPGTKQVTVSERGYLSATYHAWRWLWPGVYYSVLFPDEAHPTFSGASKDMLHDVAGTLRFDVNSHWLVKLEGHFMHGTAGLDSTLNDNRPLDALTRNWAVFLAKTTAYF